MDYTGLIKRFALPNGYQPPKELTYKDLTARPLTRADLKDDMEAVNSSLELIRKTRGGSWPEEAVNEDFDLLDLAWHEREFRDNDSFAYVIYDINDTYIGCFYLYPMGHRTKLTKELLQCDVDASWWVTTAAYEQGYYKKLYAALKQWLGSNKFPFKKVYYSNREIPEGISKE